jgi:hypothetical protein
LGRPERRERARADYARTACEAVVRGLAAVSAGQRASVDPSRSLDSVFGPARQRAAPPHSPLSLAQLLSFNAPRLLAARQTNAASTSPRLASPRLASLLLVPCPSDTVAQLQECCPLPSPPPPPPLLQPSRSSRSVPRPSQPKPKSRRPSVSTPQLEKALTLHS